MNVKVDGQINEWGWMDEQTDGHVYKQIDGQVKEKALPVRYFFYSIDAKHF